MEDSTTISNTMYDILKVMGKDSKFLYYTIDSYIEDAEKAKKRNSPIHGEK
jgi:hypothetical protein